MSGKIQHSWLRAADRPLLGRIALHAVLVSVQEQQFLTRGLMDQARDSGVPVDNDFAGQMPILEACNESRWHARSTRSCDLSPCPMSKWRAWNCWGGHRRARSVDRRRRAGQVADQRRYHVPRSDLRRRLDHHGRANRLLARGDGQYLLASRLMIGRALDGWPIDYRCVKREESRSIYASSDNQ